MVKKGQIQLSFGFIFSVIIIAATLAVAIYVIFQFIILDEKAKCAMFKTNLQEQIDKVWASDGDLSQIASYDVAPKTTNVCFGKVTQSPLDSTHQKIYDEIKKYSDSKSNLYLYPRESCGEGTFRYTLNHVNTTRFFCVQTAKGKADFRLVKDSFEPFVEIKP